MTIAIYALIVALIGVACVFFCIYYDSVAAFLSKIADICAPIMYGAVIAYILNPLMRIFEEKVLRKRNMVNGLSRTARRIFAVILTYLSFFIFIGLFVWMLLPQLTTSIKDLGEKFPSYIQAVEDLAHSIAEGGGAMGTAIETLLTRLNDFIDNSYDLLRQYLPVLTEILQSVAVGALDVVLGIVFSIYFLLSKEHILVRCSFQHLRPSFLYNSQRTQP